MLILIFTISATKMNPMDTKIIDELIAIIEDVSQGHYSNSIMEFTKPHHPEQIRRIAEAMGMMMVKVEARELRLQQLVEELRQLNDLLKRNTIQTVSAIARALGARDEYTQGHALRVAVYAQRLARRLGLPPAEIELIRIAGIFHDIGKIGFSDRAFKDIDVNCDGSLLREIRSHPVEGANILRDLDFIGPALNYVLRHHERLDGQGYPDGLKKDDIPLGAQIISVADCFDAITTDRPYKKGKRPAEAALILREISGTSLNPDLVDLFIRDIEENGLPENGAGANSG